MSEDAIQESTVRKPDLPCFEKPTGEHPTHDPIHTPQYLTTRLLLAGRQARRRRIIGSGLLTVRFGDGGRFLLQCPDIKRSVLVRGWMSLLGESH